MAVGRSPSFHLTVSDEVIDAGEHESRADEEGVKKNGHPFTCSDVAIEPPNQATEIALRCKLPNAFVAIGMPLSVRG